MTDTTTFGGGVNQESKTTEELGRVAGVEVEIDFIQTRLVRSRERNDGRTGVLSTKASDEIELIVLGNTVPENEQIETTLSAHFGAAMESQGRDDIVTFTPEQQVAGKEEGFVVGDREDAGHG